MVQKLVSLSYFMNACVKNLNKHAAVKKNYVSENQTLFMNKKLKKAIRCCTRLRNIFLMSRLEINRKKQEIFVSRPEGKLT